MLYSWYKAGRCGISLAAAPGYSNHEAGLAIDVASPDAWQSALTSNGFVRLGPSDPPHYNYNGGGGKDIRTTSVKAFQTLWNRYNPGRRLTVDGTYGPATEGALMDSPVNGW